MYHVVTRDGGKLVREPVGHDRKMAKRKLAKTQVEVDEQMYVAPQNVRFDAWVDEWFSSLRRPRANSLRGYQQTLAIAKETFGSKYVRKLTTADVTAFLKHTERCRACKGTGRVASRECGRCKSSGTRTVTSTTQRRHLRVLHSCLKAATKRHPPLAAKNPVAELDDSQRPQAERRKASPFEPGELARLWPKLSDPYRMLCKLAYATGMRQGELIALRWGAIDWQAKVIRVRESYVQRIGFEQPKSEESARDVILGAKAIALLETWRKSSLALPAATALVFPGPGRDGQLLDSTIRRALYAAMLKAGVPREWKPGHKWRDFHSFRHGFVSAMLAQGVGLQWISEQLGHSSNQRDGATLQALPH
jgi:integrase